MSMIHASVNVRHFSTDFDETKILRTQNQEIKDVLRILQLHLRRMLLNFQAKE